MMLDSFKLGGDDSAPSTLLDALGESAALAVGLRKLKSSYSGACMRVRRTSDNTQTDIGFDADGVLDWAAVAAFGSTCYVVNWYSQDGSTDLEPPTASNQPLLDQYLRQVTFDGVNDYFSMLFDASGTNKLSFLMIAKAVAAGYPVFFEHSASWYDHNAFLFYTDDGDGYIAGHHTGSDGGANYNYKSVSSNTNLRLFTIVLDRSLSGAAQTLFRIDMSPSSTAPFSNTLSGNFGDQTLYVGSRGGTSLFLSGAISELIILPTALSSGQISTSETNQDTFFGIS